MALSVTTANLATQYLAGSAADILTPSSVTHLIRTIELHNTHSSAITVKLYTQKSSVNYQDKEFSLDAGKGTIIEYSAPGKVLTTGMKLRGEASVADKITCVISGAIETA